MRTERWFNVLVLGGAALGLGCSGAEEDPREAEPQAGGSAGKGGSGGTSGSGGGAGLPVAPECSQPDALPSDACGCPCCWVMGCSNDEECCGGFCAAGNDGNGCCP